MGVDDGEGLPLLKGAWSVDTPDKGATAISIDAGVSHLEISGLRMDGYVFGIQARVTKGKALRVELALKNISINNCRYGFYLSDCHNLQIEDCILKHYTKHGFRLDAGCSNVQILRCVADCTGDDAEWETKTELFPFGYILNNKGDGCTDVCFEDCLAVNNLMPLQTTHYKNGDGFVVEGNAYDVTFLRCRAINNQDGGFDLKVPDVKLKDCVALRNTRNFRIWNTGTLDNYIATGGKTGIWNNGGPVDVNHSTFCNLTGAAVETDDRASFPLTLTACLISGAEKTTHHSSKGTAVFKECIVVEKGGDAKAPAYIKPDPKWDGLGDAMNSRTYPDKGFKGWDNKD
ncbi:MAG: right-handed parallel beta-helix repeat-containing protein [Kiritimatiellae bacterium]|jgi:hypothetical protein|nr:right-handed parallel beta-helix repeat-containing protein [Kiritimatiellia bacterium]